jgi:Tol biopolymer transport system component
MGEVYLARDTRLGRDVAVKILPAQYAADPEWRRRLDREARAISSLSHPHVCPLFDVGHQDGVDYLVMEYLEGETLAARLQRGPLSLDHVLRFGAEIASALAAAHRQGVIHRDLKPGNVMLTRTGARLLDFGLAKPAAVTASPLEATASAPITAQGTLVGTYPYMAPEQLEGRDADTRTDIFALGAVLYEMATGRRAFEGKTTASLIAAILERDPAPISSIQPLAPAAFDDIIRGCLAKDPDDRWQTAHDVTLQLESLRRRLASGAESMDAGSGVGDRARPSRWLTGLAVLVATLSLAALAAFALWPRTPAPSSAGAVRGSILPPRDHWFTPNDFQISPDGTRIAYVAAGPDGASTLWVRSIQSESATEIAGTDGASFPFWSPDGHWIAFFANGKLKKVEPAGAGLQELCAAPLNAGGGAWGDDVIVFTPTVQGGLLKVPASGGTPEPVTQVPEESRGEAHRFPQFLPDGKRFLYVTSWTTQQRGGVYLAHVDGGAPRLVSPDISGRIVLAGSTLLHVDRGTLYARDLELEEGTLTGEPRVVLRNEVVVDWRFGDVPITASSNGILVFQSRLAYNSQLVLYDRAGTELEVIGEPGFASPMLSPDGRRVAVVYDRDGTGESSTMLYDFDRRLPWGLAQGGSHTAHDWSPDGRWVYYSAMREHNGIYRRRADGSGAEETLLESPAHLLVNSYSREADRLLFMDFSDGAIRLRELDVAKSEARDVAHGAEGVYSPDGQWIGYLDQEAQGLQLMRADGGARVFAARGGSQLRWRDMKELFYIARDKKLMRVPLTVGDGTIAPGKPEALFQTRIVKSSLTLFQYDVTPAGDRFVINSLPRADAAAPLTMIVNWESAARD